MKKLLSLIVIVMFTFAVTAAVSAAQTKTVISKTPARISQPVQGVHHLLPAGPAVHGIHGKLQAPNATPLKGKPAIPIVLKPLKKPA